MDKVAERAAAATLDAAALAEWRNRTTTGLRLAADAADARANVGRGGGAARAPRGGGARPRDRVAVPPPAAGAPEVWPWNHPGGPAASRRATGGGVLASRDWGREVVQCPVCDVRVRASRINEHIDSCLGGGGGGGSSGGSGSGGGGGGGSGGGGMAAAAARRIAVRALHAFFEIGGGSRAETALSYDLSGGASSDDEIVGGASTDLSGGASTDEVYSDESEGEAFEDESQESHEEEEDEDGEDRQDVEEEEDEEDEDEDDSDPPESEGSDSNSSIDFHMARGY